MNSKRILVLVFTLFWLGISFAQVPDVDPDEVKRELEKRGLKEADVAKRLQEKGIDIYNINPEDLLEAQSTIEEVISEMEAEAAQKAAAIATDKAEEVVQQKSEAEVKKKAAQLAKESAQDIKKAVKEGADVEEAIATELIEKNQENLPPASIYGQDYFRNREDVVFNKSLEVKPPDSYVMGVGDIINVSIWGASQVSSNFEINKDGYIKPVGMPRIHLKGITYGKTKKLLKSRFSQYYNFRDEFEVTISYARTITVNVVGNVLKPGSYTIPATNTAFNALIAVGGPTDIGSLRKIKLIKASGQVKTMDVYEFLSNPKYKDNFFLENNDYIHVPVSEKVIAISGAVKRPMKYELLESENLFDLIDYAGGLTDNAYRENIQVARFEEVGKKIIDLNLAELQRSGRDFILKGGDHVSIRTIAKPAENYAEIEGAVELPGKYELKKGMKVGDLVNKGILKKQALRDIAFLFRKNTNGTIHLIKVNLNDLSNKDIELQPKDRLVVYSQSRFVDTYKISVSGAVRIPTEITYDPEKTITVADAVIMGGGLSDDAADFAYINRVNPANRKQVEYIRVNLKNALAHPQSTDNITLQAFDKLHVFSNLTFTDEAFVSIGGAVRNPGRYKYDESLTLKDALVMSGGFKLEAASNKIDIFRVTFENNTPTKTVVATVTVDKDLNFSNNDNLALEPFDQIIVRNVPDFEFQKMVRIEGEVKYPGEYALIYDNEKVASLINRAGDLTKEAFPDGALLYRKKDGTGYVVMNLEEALTNKKSGFNYVLKEGDVITIPKQKDLVTITGATKAYELYPDELVNRGKINVAYEKGRRAKYYVDEFTAGVAKKGKRRDITVLYPNGEIKKTKNFLFFNVYPKVRKGSVIHVPYKVAKKEKDKDEKKDKEKVDWNKVIKDTVGEAITILSLILLVQQIN